MALTPWHKAVDPREDLREGKPLNAAEFAVNLDRVKERKAPIDYNDPKQFFERTYLTKNLTALAAEALRRLSGERTETSAVFNMATQFGGGKTHALTLLYHLATKGPVANGWSGVNKILATANLSSVPDAAVAVFVGTEFDSLTGRGGGTEPLRKTPWGEIAYQLGKEQGFALVEKHDQQGIAPAGDVIRSMLPRDRPTLILMDELMNFISKYRSSGLSDQFFNFLQSLTTVVASEDHVVLAVSLPGSQMEMTEDDFADYNTYKKMLDKVAKAVMISAETETTEIIRRRLFEWRPDQVEPDGKIKLNPEAKKTCREYAKWAKANRKQLPPWFPFDHSEEIFEATYPFHPMVLSVFERKWRSLPGFQLTRGVLRLLALWVSKAFQENFTGAHPDALIGLGTAPLEEPNFRAAVFEQLKEDRLEGPVTTDIAGRKESHAIRLDSEANATIKRARLHRKVATTIFFESNGGQTHGTDAALSEIRMAVAQPDLDIGNVEAVLDTLSSNCYYLEARGTSFKFGLEIQLPKIHADRKASVLQPEIDESIKNAIIKVFNEGNGMKPIFFPEKSGDVPDSPALTLVVLSPDHKRQEKATLDLIDSMIKDHGTSGRTFKSALIWALADNDTALTNEARNAVAWEKIRDDAEAEILRLSDGQKKDVSGKIGKAQRDLREAVWRSYKSLAYLGRDNKVALIDLGLIHSSAARTLVDFYLQELGKRDIIAARGVSPNILIKNWPPAFVEWSTRSVRDAFFASPQFPRLMGSEAVRDVIAKGVINGMFAYVAKSEELGYDPIYSKETGLQPGDVEISDDWFIVKGDIGGPRSVVIEPGQVSLKPGGEMNFKARVLDRQGKEIEGVRLEWAAKGGTIDAQGAYKAGNSGGSFEISASVGRFRGSAKVDIIMDETIDDKVCRLVVSPKDIIIGPNKAVAFAAKGFNKDGIEVSIGNVNWSAIGGTINDSGIFQAGGEKGIFKVTATANGVGDVATVTVEKVNAYMGGEIPHQRWSQFYNRVLSKFATRKGLKLEVSVEIPDSSEEEKEEMKLALNELGLGDKIIVR